MICWQFDKGSGILKERYFLKGKNAAWEKMEIETAPALDKAAELAAIYRISLDELAGLAGEREAPGEDAPKAPAVDLHILKKLEGRRCQLEFTEENTIDAVMDGLLNNANVRILEVGERRVRIEYERKKEDAMFQKETVVREVEHSMIIGASFVEENEKEN